MHDGKKTDRRKRLSHWPIVLTLVMSFVMAGSISAVLAGEAADIDREVDLALEKCYADIPAAKELSTVAKGILVFPNVIKAGLVVGGQYGKGALREDGKTTG